MSTLPDPPLVDGELIAPVVISVHMARGGCGRCVMCPELSWDWWDLSLTGLPPVSDRSGALTDQVALHPRCIPLLIAHWGMLLDPSSSDVEDLHETDVGARPSPPARQATGAYARRGAAS